MLRAWLLACSLAEPFDVVGDIVADEFLLLVLTDAVFWWVCRWLDVPAREAAHREAFTVKGWRGERLRNSWMRTGMHSSRAALFAGHKAWLRKKGRK